MARQVENPSEAAEMTVEDLKAALDKREDLFILDVREPSEYDICHLEGAKLIPLGQLPERVGELDKNRPTIVHCRSGGRSARAAAFLRKAGFKRVVNLAGGIAAWAERIEPSMPRY